MDPPESRYRGTFYNDRVHSLKTAITFLGPTYEYLFKDGLEILAAHRLLYDVKGPQHLVVLWWEWPSFHWKELRKGGINEF